jgi:hypothetical protein
MYFARVAWEMAASELHFVGSLPYHSNFRDLALPEAQERLLAGVTDRVTFESLKDFATDEFFRRDVFGAGAMARSSSATESFLDTTTWGTLSAELPPSRSVQLPHRTVSLEGTTIEVLFRALAARPATVRESATELEGVGQEALRAALLRLVVAEQVVPMREPATAAAASADPDGLYVVPSVYNQTMLRRLAGEAPFVMVSEVAGTAFPMSALEGVAIRAVTEAAAADRAGWVEDLVGRSVLRIRVGDRVLDDRAEQRRAILETVQQLRVRLPKFVELGIVAPVRGR